MLKTQVISLIFRCLEYCKVIEVKFHKKRHIKFRQNKQP
jgi:hypothetical protein